MKKIITASFVFLSFVLFSQTDSQNGNWKERYVLKQNTTEADYMIRYGDIDNLGYGWPENFTPFSGKSTPGHDWPMQKTDTTEITGFDMVMLGSGFVDAGNGRDGYSGAKQYLQENFGKTTFDFNISLKGVDTSKVKDVTLQIFVDDFQPKEFGSRFEFYINNKRAAFVESTLNSLAQTGPIGKLITVNVPKEFIKEFKKDEVVFKIDDNTTGLGDGFAVDFFKIMINAKAIKTGIVKGTVYLPGGKVASNATITCGTKTVKSNVQGKFTLSGVPTGLAVITVTLADKTTKTFTVDVEDDNSMENELKMED